MILNKQLRDLLRKLNTCAPAHKGGWGRRVPWWAPPHLPDPVPRVGLGPNICSISNPTSLKVIVVKLLVQKFNIISDYKNVFQIFKMPLAVASEVLLL